MRRALLLVTLLAPALARAQISGQVLLNNGRTFPNFINAAECSGGATIDVKWNAAPVNVTAVPSGATYTLYASNQAPTTANTCNTASNQTTGLVVLLAASVQNPTGFVADVVVSGNQLVTGAAGTIADCSSSADQTIYLCVQGMANGVQFGFATGTVTVSTTSPPPPVVTGALAGDGALNISFDAGTATTSAPAVTQEYALEATAIGSGDPTGVHQSGRVGSSPFRLSGLVNNVVYSVRAFAFSKADNMSDPSAAVTAMPEAVRDFWDTYQADGGRETGGCSSGVAGPVGLGVLLATLALVRRRK